MKDIETVVSDNIKRLLDEYNINQTELAKIAGVSVSTVGKWVLKKATPRMGAVQKISDYFHLPKSYILEEEKADYIIKESSRTYTYIPAEISAGLPDHVEAVTNADKIKVPDSLMGKWAGHDQVYITRVNGESMNRVIPHDSLIVVRPVSLHNLKNGDIVVYKYDNEYAIKRYYNQNGKVYLRPDSDDMSFTDLIIDLESDHADLTIKGRVVLYIVELD